MEYFNKVKEHFTTTRQRSKVTFNLQHSLEHPKVAAYLFAGRAFGHATLLTFFGSTTIASGAMLSMGINDMKDASTILVRYKSYFPVSKQQTLEEEKRDTDEFFKELENTDGEEDFANSKAHAGIKNVVLKSLGPLRPQ
ncbi:hypothetical protein HDU92_003305 [Lobulomyces angularis]|nr:hypothetical protein HDU92_003305 [Lobulomyces angularis]